MPHLWYLKNGEWIAESLAASRPLHEWTRDGSALVQIASAYSRRRVHALLDAGASLQVNGESIATGMRVLRDHDEVLCPDGTRLWFSTESITEVVAYPGRADSDSDTERCPRCHCRIERGSDAVACTFCFNFYHYTADRRCFSLHDRCAVCQHATVEVGEPSLEWQPCSL